MGAAEDAAVALLARSAVGAGGLHRTRPGHGLAEVHAAIVGAFDGRGRVELGPGRRLAVVAVDGLGFRPAARTLAPDVIVPLTSEFPTTTMACMLTSLTGRPPAEHGYIGVQYLHEDGLGSVNCHTGHRDEPTSPAAARATLTPAFPTVFEALAAAGVTTIALPNELDHVHAGVRGRLFRGCGTLWPPLPPSGDPSVLVSTFAAQLTAAAAAPGPALVWGYLDLDTHIHRHGVDTSIEDACRAIDRMARDLARAGTAVLLYSDHGLTANHARARTRALWDEIASPARCRLPAGGAGRVRWLYPHAGLAQPMLEQLTGRMDDALVLTAESLASTGLLAPDSIGARRLGEVILIATGPDFPAPGPDAAYEHGSMTEDEVLVPLAIWQPDGSFPPGGGARPRRP